MERGFYLPLTEIKNKRLGLDTANAQHSRRPIDPTSWKFSKTDVQILRHYFPKEIGDIILSCNGVENEDGTVSYTPIVSSQYKELDRKVQDLHDELISHKVRESVNLNPYLEETERREMFQKCKKKYPGILLLDTYSNVIGIASKDILQAMDAKDFILTELKGKSVAGSEATLEYRKEKLKSESRSKSFDYNQSQHPSDITVKRSSAPPYLQKPYCEFQTKNNIKVKVYQGDILKARVEVITNAANEFLQHHGGVAKAISEECGSDLVTECAKIVHRSGGSLQVTDVKSTTAGLLKHKYKAVLHAVGPRWENYSDKTRCLDDLQETVYNVLKEADSVHHSQSVGIPAIGSGLSKIFSICHIWLKYLT